MSEYKCIVDGAYVDIHEPTIQTTLDAAVYALKSLEKTHATKIVSMFLDEDDRLKVDAYHHVSLLGEGEHTTFSYEYKTVRKFLEIQVEYCVRVLFSSSMIREGVIAQFYDLVFSNELNVHTIMPMLNGEEFFVYFQSEKKAWEAHAKFEYLHLLSVSDPYEVHVFLEK